METREYNLNSYKLHIIKSDKVKSVHMEIHFKDKVDESNIFYKSMLADILSDCSNKYHSRKEVSLMLEDLYKASFYGTTTKTGGVVDNVFVYNFINPKYINDKNFLKNALKLPFEMILKPFVKSKKFDSMNFEIVKKRALRDIENIKEDSVRFSLKNALKYMDSSSLSSVSVLGNQKEVEKSTSEVLYQEYINMLKNSYCDIYIIGNVDFDEMYNIVTKEFKLNTIKSGRLNLHVENSLKRKVLVVNEPGNFVQSNLNIVCNLDNFTKNEKDIVMQMYNYILGSGGLNSKLYQKIREQNSLCYGVYSIYLKYDNLLVIQVSLDKKNKDKAISLIKEALKEMKKGKITIDEFNEAKINLLKSLKMAKDNNLSILSNYIFNKFDNLPLIEERIEKLENISLKDVKNLAKKVKINTIYTLESEVMS